MDKDIKILVIPDVHGRDFWCEPVMNNLDKEIVFLGDYLDPYAHEGITPERALEVFKEIIALAKEHANITLLLGNHDAGYCLGPRVCECRHDWLNHKEIHDIFEANFNLFNLAKEKTINKKKFFFSHAGVKPYWLKCDAQYFPRGFKPTAKNFNDLLHCENADVLHSLAGLDGCGSILWADVREFIHDKEVATKKTIQVVGHTMLNFGTALRIGDNFYDLDCQRAFYIDGQGIIRYYDTDQEVKKLL